MELVKVMTVMRKEKYRQQIMDVLGEQKIQAYAIDSQSI